MESPHPFPHQRLQVYALSLELSDLCHGLVGLVPRGQGKLADNLNRANIGVPLLIGEGANRYSPGQKRQRFEEARSEVGECAVAIELGLRRGYFPPDQAARGYELCGRIGAMLTGLIKRQRR